MVLAPAAVAAQSADWDYLLNFLIGFLDGATLNDFAVHESFWVDNLIDKAPDSLRYGKAEILGNVRRKGPHPISADTEIHSARDINLRFSATRQW